MHKHYRECRITSVICYPNTVEALATTAKGSLGTRLPGMRSSSVCMRVWDPSEICETHKMHERLGLWRRESILGFSNEGLLSQHLLSWTSVEWPYPYIVYIPAQRFCHRCLSPKICSHFMSCIHTLFTSFLQKKIYCHSPKLQLWIQQMWRQHSKVFWQVGH